MKFQHREYIEFEKADPGGIIFFAEAFCLAHKTFEHFVKHIGVGYRTWFQHPEVAVPIRHSECNHLKPIFAGGEVSIELHLSYLSNTSLTANYTVKDSAGDICSEIKTTHTFINKQDLQKTSIPTDIQTKLKNYLA